MDGRGLTSLFQEHESWLVRRILRYALEHGYTRHTSTLEEAWRQSIAGLTRSLVAALDATPGVPEFGPDDDLGADPLTAFGVHEARLHRHRGVTLAMFLALSKYYRQVYVDLLLEEGGELLVEEHRRFVERSFDRIEVAFSQTWVEEISAGLDPVLQRTTLSLTREKNTYLTVFESLGDPALVLDRRGRIVNLNRAALGLLRAGPVPGAAYYDPEEGGRLHGRAATELFPWLAPALEGLTEPLVVEVGGEERVFDPRVSRMLDVTETLTTLVVLSDRTEEHRSRREAEASQTMLRTVLDTIPVGVFWKDRSCRYLGANLKFVADTGAGSAEAVLGCTDEDFWPDLAAGYRADDQRVMETGEARWFSEEPILGTDGQGWTRTTKIPLRDASGEVTGVLGSYEDISNLKRVEAALRDSDLRHRALFQFSPVALLEEDLSTVRTSIEALRDAGITDLRAYLEAQPEVVRELASQIRVTSVNRAAVGLLGGEGRAALVDGLEACWTPASLAAFREEMLAFASGERSWSGESTHLTLDGRELWTGQQAAVAPGHEESWDKVFVALTDLTTRREAELTLERARAEAERISRTDALTDTPNRRAFDEALRAEWQRGTRERKSLGMVMVDIDHFKSFNDHYGHPEGDRCLAAVARALVDAVRRPADLLARYGGEEFVALLPGTDLEGAAAVAEAMRDSLRQADLEHLASPVSSRVTASMGVAAVVPGSGVEPVALVHAADSALYRAKRTGRDQALSADPSFTPRPAPPRRR